MRMIVPVFPELTAVAVRIAKATGTSAYAQLLGLRDMSHPESRDVVARLLAERTWFPSENPIFSVRYFLNYWRETPDPFGAPKPPVWSLHVLGYDLHGEHHGSMHRTPVPIACSMGEALVHAAVQTWGPGLPEPVKVDPVAWELRSHRQVLTLFDRDDNPISPTCVGCGRAKEFCAGTPE